MFPTYTQMLKRWGAERPNHIAVIYEEKAISYSELLRDVQGLAVALQSVGVNEGDRVAVLLPTGLELITTILAIPWIGALYVPVNPKFTPVETSFILQQTQAKVLICTSDIVTPDYWAMFESVENPQPALEKVIAVGKPVARYHVSYQTLPQNKTSRTQAGDEVPYSSSSISDDFAIVYTSGTTGAAKGILVNQFSGISTGHGIAEALKLRGDDVLLSLMLLNPCNYERGGHTCSSTLPTAHCRRSPANARR
jgi:fatty-acyl-CoA synthase